MAALRRIPITFSSSSLPSSQIPDDLTARVSLPSSFTKVPKLTITPRTTRFRGRRGAAGATMLDAAAERYASALADVAKSNGSLVKTAADVEKIEKIFSDEEVYSFFTNPIIDDAKKREIIDEIVRSSRLQPHVSNFLNVLVDMKRTDIIYDIVKEFEVVYNKLTATELVVVSSAVKLESQHLAQIAREVQRLSGARNVRIKTTMDPSLVAGFTIRYGNGGSKFIDLSVKKELQDLASQLEIGDVQF